ncbi:hypothetical protein GGR53DRAFT_136174 [Hypoxylon sp. FL1150]|nr:hypothetical protein GGR53DRAFT_136174 [Hypoxylon sp. FL1150]
MPATQDSNATAPSPYKISDRLYELCQSPESVSSLVAADPSLTPGEAWKKLFGHHVPDGFSKEDIRRIGKGALEPEESERAKACGKWGPQEPGELFLRMYHDALCTLDDDLGCGMVSPSLMGSCGTMPLTILSVIPDIVRHMSNLIVRAEKEVYLATNFWQNGVASKYITNAIRELSRRAGARGTTVIVKIIYDRGSPKQLLDPHHGVPESEYTGSAVGLPARDEIPHVDLQVTNYHKPLLGTFHAKYMIVDRRVAVVQSNNIQDNDNVEMMVEVQGPIVDSLYDMALLSWHRKLEPPLPMIHSPAAGDGSRYGGVTADWKSSGKADNRQEVLGRRQAGEGTDHVEGLAKLTLDGDDSGSGNHQGQDDHGSSETSLPEHTSEDPHYDASLAGEIQRVQASLRPEAGESRTQAVSRHLNHTTNTGFAGDAPPCSPDDEMTPYIAHPPHEPAPMALVCRSPYGPPTHSSVANPQNAAWLSALRNAREGVFIQSPTLNAAPLVPAIIEACERGVDVFCYVCLGYNDAGELLPMQGGHNEAIAHKLHTTLSPTARPRLHWFWYVAKDQTRPLVASTKRRSCHVKLLIADGRVGVVGNGNQDTQSWMHSQEVNILVDSPVVCGAWEDALRRNQNTHLYGAVDPVDGVWRDGGGKEAEGATGVDAGRLSWFKGVVGAVKRVQGTGGF